MSLNLPIDRGFQELQLNDIVFEHVIFSPIEMTLAISRSSVYLIVDVLLLLFIDSSLFLFCERRSFIFQSNQLLLQLKCDR